MITPVSPAPVPNPKNWRRAPSPVAPRAAFAVLFSAAIAGATYGIAQTQTRPDSVATSPLWGKNGENWTPQSRLSDWSFAGYRSGEAPIPTPPVRGNVRDFGAIGDGEADDSAAFARAIQATDNGALLIPAGRYRLTEILYIRKSNLVLRGAGTGQTTLFFPRALEQIASKAEATTTGRPTSGYSWSGGLIWVEGKPTGADLGLLKSAAKRGDTSIELAKAPELKIGQKIEIRQSDDADKSLIDHLYGSQAGDVSQLKGASTSFVSRVVAIDLTIDGARLTLERPLRTDIDPKWSASARVFAPSVSEVGIENLGFEFPNTPYGGHFTEDGFNPLTFLGVTDCWARDLKILNADSGPFVRGNFVTVQNIVFESNRAPDKGGNRGHHGFTFGNDTLLQNFDFRQKFIHDISAEMGAGSVAASGKGLDLCFDNHKRFPHANLFTDIDLGLGTRMYASGGGANLGRNSAGWSTWWNIRAARAQKPPKAEYGPKNGSSALNFVGVQTDEAAMTETGNFWFEPLAPGGLQPANLYAAQLARRLKK